MSGPYRSRDDRPSLDSPTYTPVRLLNEVAFCLKAKNDSRLALVLELDLAQINRVRRRKEHISALMMVQIMDRTGWHITRVRELGGIPYDGAKALVVLAQHIGKRFPYMVAGTADEP